MLASLRQLPLAVLAGVLVLILANVLVGSFRFWRILAHQGMHLPWRAVLRANLAGMVAGLFVISLFGQVLGRHARLREFGVKPVVVAGLAAYERAVVTVVSGAMAVFGLVDLLGQPVLGQILASVSFGQVGIAIVIAALLGLLIGGSHFDRELLRYLRSWALYRRLLEIVGVTVVNHLLMLMAFVLAIRVFAPGTGVAEMFAAAAIISFAASIPVSVNGWGVREIAAVFVLQPLGVAEGHAVAIAAAVGLCSTMVFLAAAPLALRREPRRVPAGPEGEAPVIEVGPVHDLEKISAWVLAMACAVLVFFQLHVTFPGAAIATDLNLADPFAILALAAASLTAVVTRKAPRWRAAGFNAGLLAMSLMLGFGFIWGLPSLGVTQWALVTRLLGWLVLLGYLAAGYLVVAVGGQHGLRRFAQTMVAAAAAVVLMTTLVRLLVIYGWPLSTSQNFEGYAGNRNAFAFQLVVCLAWILAYANELRRHLTLARRRIPFGAWQALFALVLLGIYISSSRAGWIVGGVLLVGAWLYRLTPRRDLAGGVVLAMLFVLLLHGAAHLGHSTPVGHLTPGEIMNPMSPPESTPEHLLSMKKGLEMWWHNPVLGAGLGAFIAHSMPWFGRPLVVHSTPIWILAEMGLLGLAVFGAVFYMLARAALRTVFETRMPPRALMFLLLAFALFSQVHEIFYQRIFWLALGAALASPFSWRESQPAATQAELRHRVAATGLSE